MAHRRHVEPLGALIPGVLKQVEREHGVLAQVQQAWRAAAGRDLAAHSWPVSVRRGRLVVAVDGPGEHFALRFERTRIVEQLRTLTDGKVTEMVVRPSGSKRTRS